MKNKLLIVLSLIVSLTWMVIIYNFSETPSIDSNNGSKAIIRYIVEKFTDSPDKTVDKLNKPLRKCMHASVYLVLSLFLNSLIFVFFKDKIRLCNILSIIFCFIYAALDEYHQTFVVGRTGQFSDVLIDSFGAIIGCFLFNYIFKIVKDRKSISRLN